ncbi:2-amino-4-hydroxy-6-hydroxymethyldihydropteridine diphosphokinase [Candidatus Venteria ishoeyi]|uniref:2-amino-4-hydroxy-6-hydroxymethyldihydropteridine diphosphokinase n=1 Tax=Candidatus Venteria ishoeyi TaxID=1899563 RepID=A0A1H6FBV8_9GAMM|nr:2-amino-4-hydroxy-6-hydroxymethyldihydropteridine diphosphokinase [Candidatus Venteria ishoeyi]MDM8547138.1 2-amino-4-hydroxy-6-hydroxymethyldihydropteridine diphosphokinase [Candidatus Venteria ishoeyi]SEH06799.1 2-amino-4-hydroxy-6-hydroxymethyldihydropteridin e pyrophosphokinase [Candidatus Venteria ishoeyi]
MATVYISIGSNIEPAKNIHASLKDLEAHYGVIQQSPVYESAAVGFEGDDFYNLVVAFDTTDDVLTVNQTLADIEAANGRVRTDKKFSARTLDLDLLLYDELIFEQGKLRLPRDEIFKYAFVLRPLFDLIPQQKHPETGQTYAEIWENFDQDTQPLHLIHLF